MGRAVGWLPAAGGRASALRPLMPLPRRSWAGGSWGASSPTDARSWLLVLLFACPAVGSGGVCSLSGVAPGWGECLAETLCSLPRTPPEETPRPGDFSPLLPPRRRLCCSFLRAFLKVNQGENCSRSCLEATRG